MLNQSLVTSTITDFFEEYPFDEEFLVLMRNAEYPVVHVQSEISDWVADLLTSSEENRYPIEIRGKLFYRALEAEGTPAFQEEAIRCFLARKTLPVPEPDTFADESEGKADFTLTVQLVMEGEKAMVREPLLSVEGFGLYDKELEAFEDDFPEDDLIQQIIVGRPEDAQDVIIEAIPLLALFEDHMIELFDIEDVEQLEAFLQTEIENLQQTLSSIQGQPVSWDESNDEKMFTWELEGSFWRYMKAAIDWVRSGHTLHDWLLEEDLCDPSAKDMATSGSAPFTQLSLLFNEGFVAFIPNTKKLIHQTSLPTYQGQAPQLSLILGSLKNLLVELDEFLSHFGLSSGEVLRSEDAYDEGLFEAETEREAIYICTQIACVSLLRAADYAKTNKLPLVIHEQILF